MKSFLIFTNNYFSHIMIDLNKLIDKRYESKISREGGTMPRKERRMGLESTSVPPIGAPKWAVQTGNNVYRLMSSYQVICITVQLLHTLRNNEEQYHLFIIMTWHKLLLVNSHLQCRLSL